MRRKAHPAVLCLRATPWRRSIVSAISGCVQCYSISLLPSWGVASSDLFHCRFDGVGKNLPPCSKCLFNYRYAVSMLCSICPSLIYYIYGREINSDSTSARADMSTWCPPTLPNPTRGQLQQEAKLLLGQLPLAAKINSLEGGVKCLDTNVSTLHR